MGGSVSGGGGDHRRRMPWQLYSRTRDRSRIDGGRLWLAGLLCRLLRTRKKYQATDHRRAGRSSFFDPHWNEASVVLSRTFFKMGMDGAVAVDDCRFSSEEPRR